MKISNINRGRYITVLQCYGTKRGLVTLINATSFCFFFHRRAWRSVVMRDACELEALESEDEGGLMRIARKQRHVPAWCARPPCVAPLSHRRSVCVQCI